MLDKHKQQARLAFHSVDSYSVGSLVKKAFISYLITLIVGSTLLALVYCLPVANMQQSGRRSVAALQAEGVYPSLSQREYDQIDNYADAVAIGLAVNPGETGLFGALKSEHRTLKRSQEDVDNLTPIRDLQSALYPEDYDDSATGSHYYARYWHGYLILLKPLLFLGFDLHMIRLFNGALILVLLLLIGFCAIRKQAGAVLVPLLTVLVGFSYYAAAFCMEFTSVLMLSLVGTLCILWRPRWLKTPQNIPIFFFILGMLTSYFDFLTAPIVVLGLPLCTYIFSVWMADDMPRIRRVLVQVLACCAFWMIGFVLFWVSKWVLASLILQIDIWSDAVRAVEKRSSRTSGDPRTAFSYRGLFLRLFSHFRLGFLVCVVLCYFALFCMLSIRLHISKRKRFDRRLYIREAFPWVAAYATVALLPIIWTIITANHSFIHHWFTYRNYAVSFYAVLLLLSQQITFLLKAKKATTLPPAYGTPER